MRTTEGKATLDVALHGDPVEARALAEALDQPGRAERLTHGFHAYPAGLHAEAAAALLRRFPGPRVADPFCGGGTVLVEALAQGREAVGRDVSEVALLVARTRTAVVEDEVLTAMRSQARRLADVAKASREPPPEALLRRVGSWYAPGVLAELEALRQGIAAAPVDEIARGLLWACFSSILVKVSWRRSESSARREEHRRPPGTTAVLFHKKARELGRRLVALREAVPPGTPPADVRPGDARELRLGAPVDLVLTSPPYPSVYDYLPMQELREAWLGVGSPRGREIGARRSWRREGSRAARARWLADTDAWIAASARALTPGGHLVVVVGDGLVPDGPVPTRAPTVRAAAAAGLTPVAGASLLRPDHARDAGRWEHVLAFRRP